MEGARAEGARAAGEILADLKHAEKLQSPLPSARICSSF